jgi:terminase small subunit|nr:MAG TPA: Terminase small subunit [Caudoviricetes sp.]
MKNGLTKRQKEFADEYMKTGNATESAIKAGYSKKTAYAIGNEALKKSKIKEYINQKQEKIEEKITMNIAERQQFLVDIILGNIKDTKIILNEQRRYTPVEVVPSLDIRLKASDQLNRMQGVYTSTLNVNANMRSTANFDDIVEQLAKSRKGTDV